MSTVKVDFKHQVTIPNTIFKELHLNAEDFLHVTVDDHSIRLVPQKLIPEDQSWFWTPEWQAREREADEAIARGEISGPFETAEALIQHLREGK